MPESPTHASVCPGVSGKGKRVLGSQGQRGFLDQADACGWGSFPSWDLGDKACAAYFSIIFLIKGFD